MKPIVIAVTLSSALTSHLVMAQAYRYDSIEQQSILLNPAGIPPRISRGNIVSPKGSIPLRASPPGAYFEGKGSEVGRIQPPGLYRVIEDRFVPAFTGTQHWLLLQQLAGGAPSIGWAYNGNEGGPSNFTILDK